MTNYEQVVHSIFCNRRRTTSGAVRRPIQVMSRGITALTAPSMPVRDRQASHKPPGTAPGHPGHLKHAYRHWRSRAAQRRGRERSAAPSTQLRRDPTRPRGRPTCPTHPKRARAYRATLTNGPHAPATAEIGPYWPFQRSRRRSLAVSWRRRGGGSTAI